MHNRSRPLILPIVLAIASASCGGRAPEPIAEAPRPGFALPKDGPLALVVGDGGAFATMGDSAADAASRRPPMPFPLAVTAAAIQPLGQGAVLAINRTGLRRVEVCRYGPAQSGGAEETRLVIEPIPGIEGEFSGRTVAVSWARRDEALFLLFRHPIFELQAPRDPAAVVVAATASGASVMEPGIGGDAYAVFPVAADSWLAQYRTESGDRVETRYARLSADGGRSEPLERPAFERLASPEPLSGAPELLRAAADALSGPLLVEARLSDGSRRAFVRGDAGQAAPAWAQVSEDAALIVTDDWRVSVARKTDAGIGAKTLYPPAPAPGTVVRDAALIDGLVIALWEEDLFPNVGASGLVALDPGL